MSWRFLGLYSREAFLELVSLTGHELPQHVGHGNEHGAERSAPTYVRKPWTVYIEASD